MLLGCTDGTVVRALASHQCGLGLMPAKCHLWVEFVVGSRLALRVFLRVLRFSSSAITNTPNSNSARIEDLH